MIRKFGVGVLVGCASLVAASTSLVPPVAAQEFPGGDSWVTQILVPAASAPGAPPTSVTTRPDAVEYFGEPHVFFYDDTAGDLRHGVWSARDDVWLFETLDGNVTDDDGRVDGDVGQSPSAVVRGDELHVFYYDATSNDLRHAAWTPRTGEWRFDIVDGSVDTGRGQQSGLVGLAPSALAAGEHLHVFYQRDPTKGAYIGHAALGSDGQWYAQDLAPGSSPSAVVYANQLHVFYTAAGGLAHLVFDGTRWWQQAFESVSRTHSTLLVGALPDAIVHRGELFVLSLTGGIISSGTRVHHWDGTSWKVVPITFGTVMDVSTFVSDGDVLDLLYTSGNPIVPTVSQWSRWTGAVFSTTTVTEPRLSFRGVGLSYAGEAHVFYAQDNALVHAVRIDA